MKLKREKLIDVLNRISPGLGKGIKGNLIDQSDHFIFNNDLVYTFNDKITISSKGPKTKVSGAVRSYELFKLLSKIKDEEIDMTLGEGEIIITGKKKKAGIKLDAEITLEIPFDLNEVKKWKVLPKDFISATSLSLFSAARDLVMGPLTCLYFHGQYVISSDNFRLTKIGLDASMDAFLLPADSAEQLCKYEPTKYSLQGNWAHFQDEEDTVFSCRTGIEDYPEVEHLLDVKGRTITLPKKLREALDRAEILATATFEHDKRVAIEIGDNKLICTGEGEYGWLEEEIDIDYDKRKLSLLVHPAMLKDVLGHTTKAKIGKNTMLFEGENFQHVVALVK